MRRQCKNKTVLKISGGLVSMPPAFFCEKCLEVSLRIEASFEWQEVRCKEHTSRHKAIKNRLQRRDHTQTLKGKKVGGGAHQKYTRVNFDFYDYQLLLGSHAYDELVKANKVHFQTSFPIPFQSQNSAKKKIRAWDDAVNSEDVLFCVLAM